jgi:hypothetical protein
MIGLNVLLTVITCCIYVADTYERNANLHRGVDSSSLLQAYVNADFAISMVFVLLFLARRYACVLGALARNGRPW